MLVTTITISLRAEVDLCWVSGRKVASWEHTLEWGDNRDTFLFLSVTSRVWILKPAVVLGYVLVLKQAFKSLWDRYKNTGDSGWWWCSHMFYLRGFLVSIFFKSVMWIVRKTWLQHPFMLYVSIGQWTNKINIQERASPVWRDSNESLNLSGNQWIIPGCWSNFASWKRVLYGHGFVK